MQRIIAACKVCLYCTFWIFLLCAALWGVPSSIHWEFAPTSLKLGGAELYLAEGMIYLRGTEMKRFLEAAGNRLEGNELVVVAPRDVRWFAVFSSQHEQPPLPENADWRERPTFDEHSSRTGWAINSTEANGRKVVSRTALLLEYKPALAAEMLCEERDYAQSRIEFESVLDGIKQGTEPPRQTLGMVWAAIGFAFLAVALLLLRQRAL